MVTEQSIDISIINKSDFNTGSDILREMLRPNLTLDSTKDDNLKG